MNDKLPPIQDAAGWPAPNPYTRSHPTGGPYSHDDVCGFDRLNGSPCPHNSWPGPDLYDWIASDVW